MTEATQPIAHRHRDYMTRTPGISVPSTLAPPRLACQKLPLVTTMLHTPPIFVGSPEWSLPAASRHANSAIPQISESVRCCVDLAAESPRLKQRSQMQHQECRHQVCQESAPAAAVPWERRNSSVKIRSQQRDECPDTHGHGQVQNAGKVPGHKPFARRKIGLAQEGVQHQWRGDADRHVAQPCWPREDSWQDFIGVQS